jgi:hypothetical protein
MNKFVPPYLQLCRRATMISKSKVPLVAWFKCASMTHGVLLWVAHLWRVPRHEIKGNSTPHYLVPSYFCQVWSHCLPNLKLPLFPPLPWCVSCLSSQDMFMNIPSLSWPWDTRSSWRSIFLELFPLPFSSFEQQCQMKKMKLRDVMEQHLQRRSSSDQQDRWRLV